jgi:hypothetical protein
MNTDTPRTDEAAVDVWRKSNGERMETSSDKVDADFARKLEHELAAVTAQRDGMEEKLRIELRGHPDSELWGDAGLIAATMRCVDALDVVTAQRDRLAEALRQIRKGITEPTHHRRGTLEIANEALAAVKGGSE